MPQFVAYFGSSATGRQRELELEAQQEAVDEYLGRIRGELGRKFIEAESGDDIERAELKRALKYCRVAQAMLIVARLDQRIRDVGLFAAVLASGTDFLIADLPKIGQPPIHVIVATAEYGREVISQATRQGLQRAKAAGKTLGNPNVKAQQAKAVAAARHKSDAFARKRIADFKTHDPDGRLSATRLAEILIASEVPTARGGQWSAKSVASMRRRIRKLLAQDGSP